jgi:hypothetical protein
MARSRGLRQRCLSKGSADFMNASSAVRSGVDALRRAFARTQPDVPREILLPDLLSIPARAQLPTAARCRARKTWTSCARTCSRARGAFVGKGGIASCLKEHSAELSSDCKAAVTKAKTKQ